MYNRNEKIKSGINEFCEMANMPGVGLEIFNAGGGWGDQKWAPSWSVKLPSLRQGRVQTLPCSLGRQSARSPSLERGKPRLSALKRRIKSGINEFCEMANMPGVGLEIFNAGGGWGDQKWAPSWSVKLPSLRQGRVQTLPCSLGRQSARSPSLEQGKPRLSALKRRIPSFAP
ncbi:hypothetical protein T07_5332 [Trichinella nelsoni]|uniref:Uncharacterized protein n=1 Tax=Trichinella nelsoni TaxID=6336 RepID=A0A0V0SEZ8_9BILA|nr:hypothetical protein T07_5332 [Trichinella nelsoni]